MAGAGMVGAIDGFTGEAATGLRGAAGAGTPGTVADGRTAGVAGFAGMVPVGAAGFGVTVAFAASPPLRSRPRAPRSVPLACSTLMGLVSTRLAPMRNALATPACPSTTATASEAWFADELRALLNSR